MNEHDFENSLRTHAAQLARPDPTPGWKAGILSAARRARRQSAAPAPRWLLVTLGAAWAVIVLLRLSTPDSAPFLPADEPDGAVYFAYSAHADEAPPLSISSLHFNLDLLNLP
ncbi:MAG: hypothetical protein ACOYMN_26145 [Roseimicrobium sp.]